MRYLLDEDLSPRIATISRSLSLDIESVHEIGRCGFSDREQLRFAAQERRVMVTRNRDDFISLTVEFFQSGEAHFGVLLVSRRLPNRNPEAIAHAMKRWHDRHAELGSEGRYFIDFLSR
ncbi:DUF5615 family PIN-like protein [Candidatus Fermentibacteria bacterium]|nr:DUF5615 family PIN-like protein [Candidatus Fermentibacteria bacterium]